MNHDPIQSTTDQRGLSGSHLQTKNILAEANDRFGQLAENNDDVLWLIDPASGKVQYVSPSFEKVWGRPSADLYTNPGAWIDSVHPDDFKCIPHDSATHRRINRHQYRLVRPNKTECWISDTSYPVLNNRGEVCKIVRIARDISNIRFFEEQIRKLQKMKSICQFVSGTVHDFNNILSVLLMQTNLLAAMEDLLPKQHNLACEITKTVERASGLVRQLLLYSRLKSPQKQKQDLNAIISGFSPILERVVGPGIQVRYTLAEQSLSIQADSGMIEQVLMNLAVNARDAMPRGGQFTIETSRASPGELNAHHYDKSRLAPDICLSVSDTGIGIPPECLPHIFEPFFTTKDSDTDTGIGLFTVSSIVQYHHGRVNVESAIGRGTIFRLHFPSAY